MKYNGIELEPVTKPQVFDPPKEMLVWDAEDKEPVIKPVCAITGSHYYQVITCRSCYGFCAKIPEIPKPKRATNLQLAEWLSKGNGLVKLYADATYFLIHIEIDAVDCDREVREDVYIRPFGTTEWVEPTLENMGMEKMEDY